MGSLDGVDETSKQLVPRDVMDGQTCKDDVYIMNELQSS